MHALIVQILRVVREGNPDFAECVLLDAEGRKHSFIEKVPVVTREDIDANSDFPRVGVIACEIEAEWQEKDGRSLVRVSTERPWGVESEEGLLSFVVEAELLQDL